MAANIRLSRTEIAKIFQSWEFLGLSLSKKAGPLMKIAVQWTKHFLSSLGITDAASAIDAGIQKKIHGLEQQF